MTSSSLGGSSATGGPPEVIGPRIGTRSYRSCSQYWSSFVFWRYGLTGIGTDNMPKLGPPVVNPQKQPVVVREQVTSTIPSAVVLILAIANPFCSRRG